MVNQGGQGENHPDARLPLVYVPRGMIALKEAVIRLAEHRDPSRPIRQYLDHSQAWAADPLRTLPDKRDPYAWPVESGDDLAPADRVYSYLALQRSRESLREVLAEAEIATLGQTPVGDLVDVPAAYWRTDGGGQRLRFTDRKDAYEQVFFYENVFSTWMSGVEEDPAPAPKGTTARAESYTCEWLRQAFASETHPWKKPKGAYLTHAMVAFGINNYGFNRAWNRVVSEHPNPEKFRKAGRKPATKSTDN